MTDSYIYGQKISTNWPTNSDIEFTGLTDTPMDAMRNGECNFYASSLNSGMRWDALFRLAELSTIAVEGIRNSPLMQTSDSLKMKAYLGEALTSRALAYFELVKIYGDVPFNKEPSKTDLSNVYIGKVDRDTIYRNIVDELLEAQNYLPWMGESVDNLSYPSPERITKGFTKGLTARVALFAGGWSLRDGNQFPNMDVEKHPEIAEMNNYYVGRTKDWKRYYEIAAQQTAEMIGSTDNPHSLTVPYEDFWKDVSGLKFNSSNESLFEIGFGVGSSGDIGSLIGMSLGANSKRYGGRGTSGSNIKSSAYYFYSFDKDDTRRDVTVSTIGYSSDDKETLGDNPVNHFNFVKWRIYWMTDGYLSLYKTAENRIGTGINWIVMRYPDVLLMFAEAQYALHGSGATNDVAGMSAMSALEQVRERALGSGHPNISNIDADFLEAVIHERAWEFGGEALRKYDLTRWGLLSKKIELQKEATCKLLDSKGEVQIFDKVYMADELPDKLYYKYLPGDEYIDKSSINYYTRLGGAPSTDYKEAYWLNGFAVRGSNMKTWLTRVLIASTGLNASYDYTAVVAQLDSASAIQSHLATFEIGNKTCNYRHSFPIYFKNISDSRGKLSNSFGY